MSIYLVIPEINICSGRLDIFRTIDAHCRSILTKNQGIDPKYLSILVIGDQFFSILLNGDECPIKALVKHDPTFIGNDWHWELLRLIDWHYMILIMQFWSVLIGMGHWSRESWYTAIFEFAIFKFSFTKFIACQTFYVLSIELKSLLKRDDLLMFGVNLMVSYTTWLLWRREPTKLRAIPFEILRGGRNGKYIF